jgi:hypothetical protein
MIIDLLAASASTLERDPNDREASRFSQVSASTLRVR